MIYLCRLSPNLPWEEQCGVNVHAAAHDYIKSKLQFGYIGDESIVMVKYESGRGARIKVTRKLIEVFETEIMDV